jgi:hypothetical protein
MNFLMMDMNGIQFIFINSKIIIIIIILIRFLLNLIISFNINDWRFSPINI